MKTILIIVAALFAYKVYQDKSSASVSQSDPNATPINRPNRPWWVPSGINVYANVGVNAAQGGYDSAVYWASRTHPDATMPSIYMPPTGAVLVGPQSV